MPRTSLLAAFAFVAVAACSPDQTDESTAATEMTTEPTTDTAATVSMADDRREQGYSFAGDPLFSNPVDDTRLAELNVLAAPLEAKTSLTEEEYIELGRYYISANRFRDAIDLYTRGLEAYPESFRLRRHRGHRYINVRELDNAIVDLEQAVALIGDEHTDVFEYNGSGEPTATYEHWTYYHIGLYHYLNENWVEAAAGLSEVCGHGAIEPDAGRRD